MIGPKIGHLDPDSEGYVRSDCRSKVALRDFLNDFYRCATFGVLYFTAKGADKLKKYFHDKTTKIVKDLAVEEEP